ncbi:heavy metal translocating P-type ATPase [uncultured Pseudoflavonifractor sp.]|uniref:heavy metal translocating P-type ATPase n=1 Tax=uncultured Pseudoflavonifractor sp. TaxID=1221379 RepID=UPI0025EFEAB7|nr:heavy metal translocating P-type ATPase [uncultured Pseudoflavonifractor sp.]
MKFQIKHECRGRIRVQMCQPRMTLEQADLLENWLQALPQVERAAVHERTRCAIIEYKAGRRELLRSLHGFSYQDRALAELSHIHSSRALNRAYEEKLVGMVVFKAVQSLLFPTSLRAACTILKAVPYLLRAVSCLLRRKLHVEVLDGLSIGVSILRRDFSTAGSVMFLLGLGELLEEWTHKKSVDDLARSMSLNIDRVWRKTEEGEFLVPLHQVQAGDRIAVRMGSMIPLDGTVLDGEVMVNQASLTGESIPVPKRPGSPIYAGTVVEEGECVLSVTAQSGGSRYDKIVAMIEESEKLKSAAESRAASLADKLVPYTLAGSALVYLLTRNVTRALSVLMVDFSCALKLSMPLSVLSAMGEASQSRITVKGGKYLEAVARADTIVFDKTGTLTYAAPTVVQVVPFGGHDETDMLRLAACLEEHFPHSMANAVVQAAKDRGLYHEELHSRVEYLVAHGIASAVDGERVIIGSAHFVFEDEGCIIPAQEQAAFDALPRQYSHLYLAIDGVLAAVICIADPVRAEAAQVVGALRQLGVSKIVMLTGDSQRTAAAIASQVGADAFQAEVLPEDKARFVQQEREQGRTVIMIGDGINDAPALSAADVGVAISDGAAIAREIADITIAADDLYELVKLRILSQNLMGRIQTNYRFVISFNGGLIALGSLGILAPATSAMLHNLSTLGLSLHSMTRLLPVKQAKSTQKTAALSRAFVSFGQE